MQGPFRFYIVFAGPHRLSPLRMKYQANRGDLGTRIPLNMTCQAQPYIEWGKRRWTLIR